LHTPLAEVLTVIAEQAIAIFPEARTCATDHLVAIEARSGVRSLVERVSARKEKQRHLFHRQLAELMCERSVVHDIAAAHVDAMVGKGKTRGNEVRAQRWLFVSR
jgi:hypothetical protein